NAGPLFHATAQFVGKHVSDSGPQAKPLQEIAHALRYVPFGQPYAVVLQRVSELLLNPHDRIERVHRALWNQGNPGQPYLAHVFFGKRYQVDTAQPYLASGDPTRGVERAR